ncbi:putative chitinase [Seiridium cardinale]|uniref:Chitinase n=1 Tax=Seiridium cardinale TaxID=138064 RepID=A0ABR2XWG5_9PEZI
MSTVRVGYLYHSRHNQDPTSRLLNAVSWAGLILRSITTRENPPKNKRGLLEFWYNNGNETRRATPDGADTAVRNLLLRAQLKEFEDEMVGYFNIVWWFLRQQVTPLARPIVPSAEVFMTAPPNVVAVVTSTHSTDVQPTVIGNPWPSRPTSGVEVK